MDTTTHKEPSVYSHLSLGVRVVGDGCKNGND